MSAVEIVDAGVPGVTRASKLADPAALEPRVVPVPEPLVPLLPWGGLRRGSVVAVRGCTSLLFALLSRASAAGSWAAVVGRPDLGVLAAAEAGVAVERLALVPRPGADLVAVTAALLEGIELVAVAGVHRLTAAELRRLAGRARQRGAVLLALGAWPGADVRLDGEDLSWDGLGSGHGRLRSMRVTVRSTGRGAATRPRTARLTLVGSAQDHAAAPPPAGVPVDVSDGALVGVSVDARHRVLVGVRVDVPGRASAEVPGGVVAGVPDAPAPGEVLTGVPGGMSAEVPGVPAPRTEDSAAGVTAAAETVAPAGGGAAADVGAGAGGGERRGAEVAGRPALRSVR